MVDSDFCPLRMIIPQIALEGGVSAHLGGLDVPSHRLPLLGAMVRCHCWVPLLGGG